MRRYNISKNRAIAIASVPVFANQWLSVVIIMSIALLMVTQGLFAQEANKKTSGTLQLQMQGKLQWLGKAVIDNASTATQVQSGDLFEYMSINQQPAIWSAMQKEPLPIVLTQVDELPQTAGMEAWKKWLATNGLAVADITTNANAVKYSISYLIDANGQLMEASIKGNGSLQQDAVLQQFIQQKQWTAAQLQGQPVAYRGYIYLVFLQ